MQGDCSRSSVRTLMPMCTYLHACLVLCVLLSVCCYNTWIESYLGCSSTATATHDWHDHLPYMRPVALAVWAVSILRLMELRDLHPFVF